MKKFVELQSGPAEPAAGDVLEMRSQFFFSPATSPGGEGARREPPAGQLQARRKPHLEMRWGFW